MPYPVHTVDCWNLKCISWEDFTYVYTYELSPRFRYKTFSKPRRFSCTPFYLVFFPKKVNTILTSITIYELCFFLNWMWMEPYSMYMYVYVYLYIVCIFLWLTPLTNIYVSLNKAVVHFFSLLCSIIKKNDAAKEREKEDWTDNYIGKHPL